MSLITGLHHVTALAADPRENLAFYTDTLGYRLVKKTVNFDDPFTYHLYFGDHIGSPGSLLTHFPHPRANNAVHAAPEIRRTVLAIPPNTLDAWGERLQLHNVKFERCVVFGAPRLSFEDPHTMSFEFVEREDPVHRGSSPDSDLPAPRLDAAVIHVQSIEPTAQFLVERLGFEQDSHHRTSETRERRTRFTLPGAARGASIELVADASAELPRMGAGTVHHVAWRVPDDHAQTEVADRLRAVGVACTEQKDRTYFRSIYARIPGGVIFEFATDGPGFDIDESPATLGHELKLPAQHEPLRQQIEAQLIPLDTAPPQA